MLDIKDPSRGPLGMADAATIAAIIDHARALRAEMPVSVALGDVPDWNAARQIPQLPPGIAYLKLGTAQLARDSDFAARFASVQRGIASSISSSDCGNSSPHACGFASPPRWIAVAYADFELARAPSPEQILDLASTCGCAGLLIDTFAKHDKRLLDWLAERPLAAIGDQCRALGLTFALAGRLQARDLPQVLSASPDLIGIRSAACRAGDRNGHIDAEALCEFRATLRAEFARRQTELSPIP